MASPCPCLSGSIRYPSSSSTASGNSRCSSPALLLNPGVVLEVVDSLALGVSKLEHAVGLEVQHMQVVVELCCLRGVGTVHLVELFDAGLVHDGGVGQNGDDDVIFGQLIVLGKLDAAKNVCDAGNAHPSELFDLLVRHTEALQVLLTFLAVEEAEKSLRIFVVDGDCHVGVLDVVDPQKVLFPEVVQFPMSEKVIFEKILPEMESMGFELEDLGGGDFCIITEDSRQKMSYTMKKEVT